VKYLRTLAASTMFVAISVAAGARPLPLTPTYITVAPPGYDLGAVAFEGDWMIAAGGAINPDPPPESSLSTAAVMLYRRGGLGAWVFQRVLAEVPYVWDWNSTGIALAMENGLLVFELDGRLHIYERGTGGYTQSAVLDGNFDSATVRIDGQRILAGLGNCHGAAVVEKNAAGAWAVSGRLQTTDVSCSGDFSFTEQLDLSGDYALVATRDLAYDTQAFRRIAGQLAWPKTATLPPRDTDGFANTAVGLRGPLALLSGDAGEGTRMFRRADASGTVWNRSGTLRTVDLYANSRGHVGLIRNRGDLWLLGDDLWRQNADNSFEHLVRLDEGAWSGDVAGRTIVTSHRDGIATYILPTSFSASPAPLRDDFQGGGNIAWQLRDGFINAQSGFTRVLRNTQATPTEEALVTGNDWRNQSLQVDVRPTSFNGAGSFVGLTVRRADDGSFYQARFEQNRVRLIRRSQGDAVIATASVGLTVNRTYRLRLETRDAALRVFVDGTLVASAVDRTLTHGGAGLVAWSALADFDNVVLSPVSTQLFGPNDLTDAGNWTVRGGTWVDDFQSTPRVRRQTNNLGAARSLTGVPETDDQIVETGVRIDSLPPDGDRWVGVIARYRDDANLYYVSLRVNSGLQIRRVVNGAATVLASVPYTVQGNRTYRLRLEAIGDQLRAYVDGAFVAEARDASLGTGRFGIATNRAAASFFEVDVRQP
jgi:hypothetical protein